MVIADAHVDDLNTPLLDTALAIIKEVRPDFIKVLGDFLSLSAVSHWPRVSADVSKYMTSVGAGNCALDRLQGIAPDSAIDFLEGNHCAWVRQYVGLHPELDGTLSVPLQLRLKERGVRWVPEEQASVESWGVYHHGHHAKSTASAAQFYANIFGPRYSARRVFFGHFHNFNVYQSATGCEAMCCGYLGADSPPYTRGSPTAWAQGLVVQEVSDSLCTSTPVRIVNGRAVYGGRVVSAAA